MESIFQKVEDVGRVQCTKDEETMFSEDVQCNSHQSPLVNCYY